MNERSKGGTRIYHGWLVVAASMIILAAATGVSDSFSVFVLPLSWEFGLSRSYLAGAFAIAVLTNGLTQPIIGHLSDRYNSRRVILVSVAVAGLASVGLNWTSQYWHLIVLFSLVFSTASGGASFGILGPLAARWFLKRRTLVLALLLSAPTVGGIFFTPTASLLLASYGWREAWIVLGSVLLFPALLLGLIFLRNWPSEMGLKADGDPESPVEASMRGGAPVGQRGRFEVDRWWRAFRSPPVYALLPAFAIAGFAISPASTLSMFSTFAVESVGIDLADIWIVQPVMAVLGAIGALAAGWLADRFPRKKVLGAALLAQGIALLVLTAVQTPAGIWLFAVLAGLSGTAWMVIALSLIADIYGLRALATLWGFAFLFHAIGRVSGPVLIGLAWDFTGSYVLPMAVGALMLVLASIMVFAINESKYSARYQAAIGVGTVGN